MPETLPSIGGDDNIWGVVLNHFLRVSFNADGSLFTGPTITYSDATSPAFTMNGQPNPNLASASAPGLMQLGGDLNGAGSSATAPLLKTVITAGSVGSATQVPIITYDANGRITSTTTASITSGTQRTFPFFIAG